MHGFGCNLIGYDIEANNELVEKYNMQYMPLGDLCKGADVISLHVPLNTNTHHLIDEYIIEKMKAGVIIINTSRGEVLNTEHVINGLKNNIIGALGLDVYEHEKELFFKDYSYDFPNDDVLIKLNAIPNVLITGHHAFLTDEALTNIAETTIYNYRLLE